MWPTLWLCRCQYPVVRYHRAGVADWYPNATGILRGWAQRCGRALVKLKTRAVVGVAPALAQVQTILRPSKNTICLPRHPGQAPSLDALAHRGRPVGRADTRAGAEAGRASRPVTQHAITTLQMMHEVAQRLIPQIVQWITTRWWPRQNPPCGVTQARALVRHKVGKEVEFGLPYLLSRLGGGYLFGTMIRGVVDESKMPLQALAGYRTIFGRTPPPRCWSTTACVCHADAARPRARRGPGHRHPAQGPRGVARCRGRPLGCAQRAWQY